MTPEQVKEVIERSSKGEGVVSVIRRMGLEIYPSLEYLRNHHNDEIRAAKVRQCESLIDWFNKAAQDAIGDLNAIPKPKAAKKKVAAKPKPKKKPAKKQVKPPKRAKPVRRRRNCCR